MPEHTPAYSVRHESLEEIHDPEKRKEHEDCEGKGEDRGRGNRIEEVKRGVSRINVEKREMVCIKWYTYMRDNMTGRR